MRKADLVFVSLAALSVAGLVLMEEPGSTAGGPRRVAVDPAADPGQAGAAQAAPARQAAPGADAVAAAPAARRDGAATPMLPGEAAFFARGRLSMPALRQAMAGDGFQARMAALERQAAVDPDASALTRGYATALGAQFRATGLARDPRRIACGLSLCLGSLTSDADDATYARWWSTFERGATAPHTIDIDYTLDLGGGLREHRFAFVTDPSIRGLIDRAR